MCDRLLYPEPVLDWAGEIALDEAIGGDYDPRVDLLQAHLRTTLTVPPLLRLGALVAVPTAQRYTPRGMPYPLRQIPTWTQAYRDVSGTVGSLARDPYLRHILREKLQVPDVHHQETFSGRDLLAAIESPLDEVHVIEQLVCEFGVD